MSLGPCWREESLPATLVLSWAITRRPNVQPQGAWPSLEKVVSGVEWGRASGHQWVPCLFLASAKPRAGLTWPECSCSGSQDSAGFAPESCLPGPQGALRHDVMQQDHLFPAAGLVCPRPVPHAGVRRRGGGHLLGGQESLSTAFVLVILAWQ